MKVACMHSISVLGMLIVVLTMACGTSRGDIIRLNDGTEVCGKIVAEMDNIVMVQSEEGFERVLRKDIREIIKGEIPKTENELSREHFNARNIRKLSISAIMLDVDIWLQKLEPLHRSQKKKLSRAQIDARLKRAQALSTWSFKWCESGFFVVGIDDINDVRFVLDSSRYICRQDISLLRKGICSKCGNSGWLECEKCRGKGKISYRKTVKKTSAKKGTRKVSVLKTKKCPVCGGRGEVLCSRPFHAAEKRARKIGGLERLVQLEMAIIKHRDTLGVIKSDAARYNAKDLKELAERTHRDGYYYITLQILQLHKKLERNIK